MYEIAKMLKLKFKFMFGFCPGVPVHKGKTIFQSLFRSHWLAVVYCLVLYLVNRYTRTEPMNG